MKSVEPQIYLIAKSQVDRAEARQWLNDLGATEYVIPEGCTEAE